MRSSLSLYYHTLRHLRPIQFYGRAWFRLYRPTPDKRPAPRLRARQGQWQAFPPHAGKMLWPFRFRFLNVPHDVESLHDWNHIALEKLWLYNLHYFEDLMRHDWPNWTTPHTTLIKRWIIENPPGTGNGWEPYPLSLRIVNWIKWPALPPFALNSLAQQARYLRSRLEIHLLGNHLFANAKALVFAGAFFNAAEADEWLHKGIAILRRELKEQILDDGGHFELSPMYHSIILEDVLDLINLANAYPGIVPMDFVEELRSTEYHMRHWLMTMTHPDYDISFFNDAAVGIASPPQLLREYATRLGGKPIDPISDGITRLAHSGYIRLQRHSITVLFDAARLGPDYLPGHAHADTLSFELSWNDCRVLCNSGTSCYGVSTQRHWERSTAAHNTVAINDCDSSEVWGGFRVARRAHPLAVESNVRNGKLVAHASHDGYRRLAGQPLHEREIAIGDNIVRWIDRISSPVSHSIVGRLPLHPDIGLQMIEPHRWQLTLPNGTQLELRRENGAPLEIEKGTYAAEFGKLQERTVLTWRVTGTNIEEQFSICAITP